MPERTREQLEEAICRGNQRARELRDKSATGLTDEELDEEKVLRERLRNDRKEYSRRFGGGIKRVDDDDVILVDLDSEDDDESITDDDDPDDDK